MMMKNILPFFLLAALHLSSGEAQASDSNKIVPTERTSVLTTQKAAGGTYVGTIPCADCKGIKMELTLADNKAGKGKTYVLKQTYLGKPAGKNALQSTGKWFAATGNSQNPKAVIYQLIPDKAYEPLYFERLNDKTIEMLDQDQNKIAAKGNYKLQKQP
ncbi:copper resistance protein NlpE N-terminal domain-containing protein [Pontibacter sp. 172403-2]|uniref:copper resistance protein NlpE n=1 Tax=Pontibacter rufus TaxID=2791028 RepID=UPI0018AF8138|nr:copper resistance protein NlpE [Pontibacter sp. 172403-2]MBF9252613.1 copper resistance protein NlpE N-terminal domain-containing protein [Pontibacter sp. 172403-2]